MGVMGAGEVALLEHLTKVNFDRGGDGVEGEIVLGVVEGVFQVAADLVEREEHEADQG